MMDQSFISSLHHFLSSFIKQIFTIILDFRKLLPLHKKQPNIFDMWNVDHITCLNAYKFLDVI